MDIAQKYIHGLKNAYLSCGLAEEWDCFEKTISGASDEEIANIQTIYPDCPRSLFEILKYVDGTYYREYQDETILFYFLGSDVPEYPYYLLSAKEICENQNNAAHYVDYIERSFEDVYVDDKIVESVSGLKWLHYSDCMNNGGTSQLFIDFTPSPSGKVGQIVRFLHDPDEFKVIADSFDEYLKKVMENQYDFINEDAFLE